MSIHLDFSFPILLGEVVSYAIFILCWWHARRRGPGYPGELFGGLLFGLVLEYVNVTFITGYHYGNWIIMFGPIPLGVAVGWAIIMYAAMLTSDRLGLPAWAAPFADTLLAINIDLSMDAVAIRLGLWIWEWPQGVDRWAAQWFGVPYANFFGWLLVVLLYSACSRILRRLAPRVPEMWRALRAVLFPVIAVALSEAALFAILRNTNYATPFLEMMLVLIGLALGVVLAAWNARKPKGGLPARSALVAFLVPFYFHLYFFLGLFLPMPDRPLVLFAISLLMMTLGLAVHVGTARGEVGRIGNLLRGEVESRRGAAG